MEKTFTKHDTNQKIYYLLLLTTILHTLEEATQQTRNV